LALLVAVAMERCGLHRRVAIAVRLLLMPALFDLDSGKFPAWAARLQALNSTIPSLRLATSP